MPAACAAEARARTEAAQGLAIRGPQPALQGRVARKANAAGRMLRLSAEAAHSAEAELVLASESAASDSTMPVSREAAAPSAEEAGRSKARA